MEGRCPGCNRAYDISEEFLSMGGKAKCPHCLLELEFDQAGSSSGADRFHDVTRADDRRHRLSYEEETGEVDEVDSHCPSCDRRFKVDKKYLELGGAAQCPHCGVDLVFDSGDVPQPDLEPEVPEPEPSQDYGDQMDGTDAWGESGEISLPELDELRVPTSVEEPPSEGAEEYQEDQEDDSVSFDEEVEEEIDQGEPTREEAEAEDLADEMPTQMMTGSPSVQVDEDRSEEGLPEESLPEEGGEFEPSEPQEEPPADLAEELFGDEAGEEQSEEGAAEPAEQEAGSPVVLEEQPSSPDGPFGALASNKDWASAAARWAESGFKADEMPSFIKGEDEPGEEEEAAAGEPLPPGGELFIAEAAEGAVEVSDADILMMETSEAEILPEPAPAEAGPTWAETASKEVEADRVKKPPMAKAKRVAEKPSLLGRLKSPWMIAAVGGGAIVIVVVILLVFLGGGEDVAGYRFPIKGIKASVVKAPAPSEYQAKEEALEHYALGNRLAYQGKFEDAILEFKSALRLDPGYPHPHRALGAVYAALGKPKLSASSYETYLRLSPHSADAHQVRQIVKATGGN